MLLGSFWGAIWVSGEPLGMVSKPDATLDTTLDP